MSRWIRSHGRLLNNLENKQAMNIEKIKKIPLEDFLGRAGFSPVRRQGDSVWYLSPFRQERTPSFKVSLSLNL